jgi:hypothetical protein
VHAMSDSYSIQEVGGAELARHYPDRGVISQSDYHRAFLTAGKRASGWRRLFAKNERFMAVLSADKDGLRVFIALDNFAVFIPWSEITLSAERSTPGTVVRLQTAAVPSLDLEFHLDDAAADILFSGVMAPLPKRDPPGRIYWPKPWATGVLLGLMLAAAVSLALLSLPWLVQVAAVVILSVAIWIFWHTCRPFFEVEKPSPYSQREKDS